MLVSEQNFPFSISQICILKLYKVVSWFQETSEASPLVEDVKEPVIKDEEKTEAVAPEVPETNGDLDTTVDDSAKSPTDETEKKEEKKRKKKKSWSFRSISFSKKDKSKPTIKENSTTDVKTETVPEVSAKQ